MNARALILLAVASLIAPGTLHAEVVWSDEFNGDSIDYETWTYDVGGWGFGNGQFEYNTARRENSYTTNGTLVIEALRESYSGNQFTSARMVTQGRFAFKYGTLEARIKMPDTANGLWPAFWMLGNNFPAIDWPDCGEVDIVEMGSQSGIAQGLQQERINSALHFSDAADAYDYAVAWTNARVDLSLDYHLYKVSWTPTTMSLHLDGVQFASWDITAPHLAEFHQPSFLILNLAIGGWDPSYTGVYSPAAVTATFPARMVVDWIRLSDNPYTEIYLGPDTEETGNFGVFTETTPVTSHLAYQTGTESGFPYGTTAALFTWNNMTPATPTTPAEGSEAWSFAIAGGDWFGMGVLVPTFRNMKNYSDGTLHVDLKTTSTTAMKIGVKSSRAGEFWLPIGDETAEFGFARDGGWHTVSIPLNRYANTDFNTIHQMFMIAGDPPPAALTLSIDNVWWEPSVPRPTPTGGNLGVYTETDAHRDAGEFTLGVDGGFFVWDHTLNPATQVPLEGSQSISLQSAPGLPWFGAAFTPNVKHNLTAFDNPNGKLVFAMKTTSSAAFQVGMKSGNMDGVGQAWIPFQAGADPYGFVRDGNWHVLEIPVADLAVDVDLSQVSQLFQVLGTRGPISDIELDDIYFAGGIARTTNVVSADVRYGIGIRWPTSPGTNYTVHWTDALDTNTVWQTLSPPVAGDGASQTLFDPNGIEPGKSYRVLQLP